MKDGTFNKEGHKSVYVSTWDNEGRLEHGGVSNIELEFLNVIYVKV